MVDGQSIFIYLGGGSKNPHKEFAGFKLFGVFGIKFKKKSAWSSFPNNIFKNGFEVAQHQKKTHNLL